MAHRSPRCPDCSSSTTRPIVYGEPGGDLVSQAEKGEVILGGCCITEGDPAWQCLDCGRQFGNRRRPLAAFFRPSPFARELTRRMRLWRQGYDGSRQVLFDRWEEGIHPDWRDEAIAAVEEDGVRLHSHIDAITSSQIFALNLFLPFRKGSRLALAARLSSILGVEFAIERIAFEWVPPGGMLGEIAGDRPLDEEPATAVDVVLWGQIAGNAPAAVLLEVKLTEGGFTPNLAIARALEQEGTVSRAWFGLCAHDRNLDVARRWALWRSVLPDAEMAPEIPASHVVAAGRDAGHEDWAAWMSARYLLQEEE